MARPSPNNTPKLAYDLQDLIASGLFSHASFYRAVAAGKIRALKQGRRTVIMPEEVDRYRASLPAWTPAKSRVAA